MEKRKEEYKRNSINVHQRLGTDVHVTQEEMDTERRNTKVYDYLCRLEEAKSWIGRVASIPESYEEFEEEMRKGVYLAEVAKFYSPRSVKGIFIDETLQYRHTDNINFFLDALHDLGVPKHFFFEVIDLYEKKNFPKVVYCIHALAHFLSTKGVAGGIESATGKVFSQSDMDRLDSELDNIKMPEFGKIKKDMIMEDNECIDECIKDECLEFERIRKAAEEELLRAAGEEMSEEEEVSEEEKVVLKIKTFLHAKAFEDIYYRKNVSLFSIRKFLFIFFKATNEMIKETEIDDLHKRINKKLKDIYDKEVYLEDIENRIRLMISNKLELHNIKARPSQVGEMDLKPLENVLHRLLTNPKYLAHLLMNVEDKEAFISSTVLPIFSQVSGKKEEYLFINLVMEILKKEKGNMGEGRNIEGRIVEGERSFPHSSSHPSTHTSHTSVILMLSYFRKSREGKIFREGLYKIVRNLDNIEVESNPSEIYKSLFNKQVPMDEALENEKVKEGMKTSLMVVRGVLSSIIQFIEANIDNIPYILRYFFKVYGTSHFFSGFISQFLLAPDAFSPEMKMSKSLRSKAYKIVQLLTFVVENSDPDFFGNSSMSHTDSNVSHTDSNMSHTDSNMSHTSLDHTTSDTSLNDLNMEMSFYSPIFPSLKTISLKYQDILSTVTSVSTLDNYFQLESLNELVRIQKSVVYLKVKDANALTLLLRNNIDSFDEALADPILSLETLPDENNLTLALSLLNSEVFVQYNEKEIALENFLRNTKRKVIYLIRICRGRNIVDLLTRDSTQEEREMYLRIKDEEMSDVIRMSKIPDVDALSSITYPPQFGFEGLDDLKENVADDLKFLENKGITSKACLYSEILSMLAYDIVLLRFMSQERTRELRVNQMTMSNLDTKEEYLDLKTQEYDDYFQTYSAKMVSRRTLSYPEDSPIRTLKKESPYGSYYFTAEDLVGLGILHQVYDVPDSRDVFFILRSEDPLDFSLEVYINNLQISSPYSFRLEDILYMKKINQKVFDVLGICSFNTNDFVKLLNERYIH